MKSSLRNGFIILFFSYYELIISRTQLQPNEFKNITFLKHTENLTYKMLKSSDFESRNYKILTIRETIPMIAGLTDLELQIFGVYYLYLRAVISEKVRKILDIN